MKPIKTPRTNTVLGAPPGWNDSQHGFCIGLPVLQAEGPYFYSYWATTWRERLSILIGRPVRLCVVGGSHPPVALDTERV